MKKFDKNLKISIISFSLFIVVLIVFSVLSSLVQNRYIPDFSFSQRVQSILAFVIFLPLLLSLFFIGRHFKSKHLKISSHFILISVSLFIFGILQILLSFLGVYGA